MAGPGGSRIVLTADRSLTAGYALLFDGMAAASATTLLPAFLNDFLMPPSGRPRVAPLGLRRLEAALRRSGLPGTDVTVTDEAGLDEAIGPGTRVVGLSSGDPAGRGMNSSTMEALTGGRSLPSVLFQGLLHRVRALARERAPGARLVLGGPGAWQISAAEARQAGIHHVLRGYAEGEAPSFFERLLRGEDLPETVTLQGPPPEAIPPILGPATMGAVELSRGCGLGCSFCTLSREPMIHLPPATILEDARINLEGGRRNLSLLSEDFFRYGGRGTRTNPPALLELIRSLRALPRLRLLQIDHANLASVAQFTDGELLTLRELLAGSPPHRYLWVNVGVETASGPLLRRQGGAAKMGGTSASEWGDFAAAQVGRLLRAGFFPFVSLMVGLPGETAEDVERTREWVERLGEARLAVFPLRYAPLEEGGAAPRLTERHWRLIRTCYRFNFRWIPLLYEDNQRGAGIPAGRRWLTRALGRGQILWWRFRLWRNRWRAGE